MQKIVIRNEPSMEVKMIAFPYQLQAFQFIKDLEYAAIFHEQGLGKTKIAIDLMIYWLNQKFVDTIVIVTKKQLILNWISEFEAHTYIKPVILSTNKKDNYYIFNGSSRVVLVNFELVISELERLKYFLKSKDVAIIIDESAKMKDPESKIAKSLFELAPFFKRRVIMTGTPVANRPYDIWSQIYFLDFGKSLGENFVLFKANTDLTNSLVRNKEAAEIFEDTLKGIFQKISEFTVRETKKSGVISLPNKEYIDVFVDFSSQQRKMYYKLKSELYLLVEKDEQSKLDSSKTILKRLLRLIQITSNPRLVDDLYGELCGKEVKLRELLDIIVSNGEKVIVWSNFVENIEYLAKRNSDLGCVKVHGRLSIADRYKAIKKFKSDPQIKVLFATPASSKEGLTLTVANHVIFYDRTLSLDDYLQAQDRIHRISQTKICYIYNIMVNNSIDQWVDNLLKAKENAAHLAQGDYSLDEYLKYKDYSFGSIVKLLLAGGENNE